MGKNVHHPPMSLRGSLAHASTEQAQVSFHLLSSKAGKVVLLSSTAFGSLQSSGLVFLPSYHLVTLPFILLELFTELDTSLYHHHHHHRRVCSSAAITHSFDRRLTDSLSFHELKRSCLASERCFSCLQLHSFVNLRPNQRVSQPSLKDKRLCFGRLDPPNLIKRAILPRPAQCPLQQARLSAKRWATGFVPPSAAVQAMMTRMRRGQRYRL